MSPLEVDTIEGQATLVHSLRLNPTFAEGSEGAQVADSRSVHARRHRRPFRFPPHKTEQNPLAGELSKEEPTPEPPKSVTAFTLDGYIDRMGNDPTRLSGLHLLFSQGVEVFGVEVVGQKGRPTEHSAFVAGDQTVQAAPDHTGQLKMPRTSLRGPVSVVDGKRGTETKVLIHRG